MKFVLFQQNNAGPQLPGLFTERGVIDISGAVRSSYTPQLVMEGIIDNFETLRPALDKLMQTAPALPLSSAPLLAARKTTYVRKQSQPRSNPHILPWPRLMVARITGAVT